jgi:hypothetical protein
MKELVFVDPAAIVVNPLTSINLRDNITIPMVFFKD